MKLPIPTSKPTLEVELAEFDIWITPSLGEIRDTDRFKQELESVSIVFEALAAHTSQFDRKENCSAPAIATALLALLEGKDVVEANKLLLGAAALLFLCTGKSDNNAKCQLPLHLRDKAKWREFPSLSLVRGARQIRNKPIPRVLSTERLMPLIAELHSAADLQRRLLEEFIKFVLSDDGYVNQLWSIGHSYVAMRRVNQHLALLTPLVIFQVRGSVSASGGHRPEQILRELFVDLGMEAGVDFNTADVIIDGANANHGENSEDEENGDTEVRSKRRNKTRAYDFVLPFATDGWSPFIYIQSQYYAGDSGSVSHKNVDQASQSRGKVKLVNPQARFVEYVDGAGYFASLNGDLKSLLSMSNTHDFFQVRSAPIKMRRALQEIGFLTLLEIEHAVARTDGGKAETIAILEREGYKRAEIDRVMRHAISNGGLGEVKGKLVLSSERRDLVRRYFLLDTAARSGAILRNGPLPGYLLVPGYGPFYGMSRVDLLSSAISSSTQFAKEFGDSVKFMTDLQWLEDRKFVMSV